MIDHEGYITSNDRKLSQLIQPLDDLDEFFELSSVTVNAWDDAIDTNISECHVIDPIQDAEGLTRYDLDADFSDRLSLRGEISKGSDSIGSNIARDKYCSLFTKPITTSLDDLGYLMSSLLDPDQIIAVISTVSVNQSKGASPELLSKL